MSNNKQSSSIDWLINRWKKLQSQGEKMNWNQIIQITELVKEIHRTEIIESYASGSNDRLKNTINTNYYNETYGDNNEQHTKK